MTAFQVQTFVPQDGTLAITLPEKFRGTVMSLDHVSLVRKS